MDAKQDFAISGGVFLYVFLAGCISSGIKTLQVLKAPEVHLFESLDGCIFVTEKLAELWPFF